MAKLQIASAPEGVSKALLQKVLVEFENYTKQKTPSNISIVFVSKTVAKQLNYRYANNNYPTDVLSFDYSNTDLQTGKIPNIGGEIVICTSLAAENAKKYKLDLESEVALLLLHGLLHIFGLDHQTKRDQSRFEHIQSDILKKLKLNYRKMTWLH